MASESGGKLLARLGAKISMKDIEYELFEDGPFPGSVFEFYGESGCGKSQCILHVISKCLLPSSWCDIAIAGRDASVILIDTDYHFNIIRLAEIMEKMMKKQIERHYQEEKLDFTKTTTDNLFERVEEVIKNSLRRLYVIHCSSLITLLVTMETVESRCANNPEVCLLVIDSISAFYDGTAGSEKKRYFPKLVDKLEQLVNTYKCVLLVTKSILFQSRDSLEDGSNIGSYQENGGVMPRHHEFMGKEWTKLVTNRLIFSKGYFAGQSCGRFVIYHEFGFKNKKAIEFTIQCDGIDFKVS